MSMQVGHTREVREAYDVRIAELTRQGYSSREIAQILSLTQRTVVRSRRRSGVAQPPRPPLTDAERAHAEELFADGCSSQEVARTLGRSASTIWVNFPGRGWTKAQVAEYAAWQRTTRAVL